MPVWSAQTVLPGEEAAEGLALALERLDPAPAGIGVFEIEDGSGLWEAAAWFEAPPDGAALALAAAAFGARDFAVGRVEDRDWVAQVQRELVPVRVGRFFVHGRHDADKVPANGIALRIEAAMAFGTGHHGTTVGCLAALDRLARRGFRARRVADIGTGTGVLAMGAARLLAVPAIATDIDPVAVATARANVAANGLRMRVRTGQAAGFRTPLLARDAPYDLVFANILARPLKALARDMVRFTAPGGVAVLSGLLLRQGAGVEAVYRGHGFRCRDRIALGDWATLVLERTRRR